MRAVAVLSAVLLLSGCAMLQRQLAPSVPPPAAAPVAKPEPARPPHKAKPHVEKPPAPVIPAAAPAPAASPPPPVPDYSARCHAMAGNRADDAKQLGATAADQTKVKTDTYADCMKQSVPSPYP